MSELLADAFRASVAENGISLQFGTSGSAADDATVVLKRCVVLSPATALRLRSRLVEALREAERRASVPPQVAAAAMATTPVNQALDPSGRRAAELHRLVAGLGVAYLHERSFRMSPSGLLANRMLLSVSKERLGVDAAAKVLALCRRLALPSPLCEHVEQHVEGARCVHFGFEADAQGSLYKVYFERRDADTEAAHASPVLLHVAYKWHPDDPASHVVTRYEWHPRLSAETMRERMAAIYGEGAPFAAAVAMLELACARVAVTRLQYLEVREGGNERLSFDLNLYDGRLRVRDAQGPLARLREHFGLRPGEFQALYDQVSAKPLGHFAGGVHRDGRPFATIYYGGEGRS